jgi:LmbE family N-acetylglucosaminyl deacetylase
MSPGPIDAVLRALAARQPIDLPIAVAVAHPDDETIGLGPFLHLFRRVRLIHVTDGAPRDLGDAHAAGFATCQAYAAARRQELRAALTAGGVAGVEALTPERPVPVPERTAIVRESRSFTDFVPSAGGSADLVTPITAGLDPAIPPGLDTTNKRACSKADRWTPAGIAGASPLGIAGAGLARKGAGQPSSDLGRSAPNPGLTFIQPPGPASTRLGPVHARGRAHARDGCARLPVPDQEASQDLAGLAACFRSILQGVEAVFTHPYEGGHPDHDATAFAVHAAGIPIVEMAGYHTAPDGGIEVGRFSGTGPEVVIALTQDEQARRNAMIACFRTQQETLRPFMGWTEMRFRPAPRYDFTRPPAERAYYDSFSWGITSERWCALAAEALQC